MIVFKAILRELPTSSGTVSVRGSLSYSPQEAWVFGGSVRSNILFGEPFEEKRYWEVLRLFIGSMSDHSLPMSVTH